MNALNLLSGGAANGLVNRIQPRFQALTGLSIQGTFSAVGQMKESLLAGAPCDLIILSDALIAELMAAGRLEPGSARPLGVVKTGVCVPQDEAAVDVRDEAALARTLAAAQAIYFPDPVKATAGIHFMKVLQRLGLDQTMASRLRVFPNGQTAMATMARDAQAGQQGLVGCTQVTEILNTPGVSLCGMLPPGFELLTVYTAAVVRGAPGAAAAQQLIELLTDAESAPVRQACGFD